MWYCRRHQGSNRGHSPASTRLWLSITSMWSCSAPSTATRYQVRSPSCLSNSVSYYFSPFSPPSHFDLRVHEDAKPFLDSGSLGDSLSLVFWVFRFMYANPSVIFPISGPVSFLSKHFLVLLTYIFNGCLPKLCLSSRLHLLLFHCRAQVPRTELGA